MDGAREERLKMKTMNGKKKRGKCCEYNKNQLLHITLNSRSCTVTPLAIHGKSRGKNALTRPSI